MFGEAVHRSYWKQLYGQEENKLCTAADTCTAAETQQGEYKAALWRWKEEWTEIPQLFCYQLSFSVSAPSQQNVINHLSTPELPKVFSPPSGKPAGRIWQLPALPSLTATKDYLKGQGLKRMHSRP